MIIFANIILYIIYKDIYYIRILFIKMAEKIPLLTRLSL